MKESNSQEDFKIKVGLFLLLLAMAFFEFSHKVAAIAKK